MEVESVVNDENIEKVNAALGVTQKQKLDGASHLRRLGTNSVNTSEANEKEQNNAETADTLPKNEESGKEVSDRFGRKKRRRGSKRNKQRKPRQKYKPYNKLTWDEKRRLDEQDAIKALRRREELVLQKGRPIAPYNTTQFLMEEHDPGDAKFELLHGNTEESEESCCSSSNSSDEYFVKDFAEFYDSVHIDTLNSCTKADLIKNVFELESRLEILEKTKNVDISLLKAENEKLLLEIENLKKSSNDSLKNDAKHPEED